MFLNKYQKRLKILKRKKQINRKIQKLKLKTQKRKQKVKKKKQKQSQKQFGIGT